MGYDYSLSDDEMHRQAQQLVRQLAPALHGTDPRITGATLAELLAMLLAGHNPDLREDTLQLILATTRKMTDFFVEKMIERGAAPPEWQRSTLQ